MPDVEAIVSSALRSDANIIALVDDRVYGELPKDVADRVGPLVRLARIGGGPTGQPLHLDAALMQFDVWGGSKKQAREVAATIAAVLDELAGTAGADGYITGTAPGSVRYVPDETFTPHRPRYVVDVIVYARPN
jgi:hypothetical protein